MEYRLARGADGNRHMPRDLPHVIADVTHFVYCATLEVARSIYMSLKQVSVDKLRLDKYIKATGLLSLCPGKCFVSVFSIFSASGIIIIFMKCFRR